MPRHHEFLQESLKFLDSIRTLGNIELPCIYGWKLCIHSLLGFGEHLKAEHDFKFIFTSRLYQDCTENLFSVIHGKGSFRDNPDAIQFKDAFKYVVADKLFVQSGKSNCKVDNYEILMDISSVAMAKYMKPVPINVEKPPNTDISLIITPSLSLPVKNVAGIYGRILTQKDTH